MDLVARCVILLLAIAGSVMAGKHANYYEKYQLDLHYNKTKQNSLRKRTGYPNRRRTQLYSRNTGRFIQVISKGKVVARGVDGDKYADLEILTVAFGKVHIRGMEKSLYICFGKRGRLVAKKEPTPKCIFREQHGADAYTMYESEVLNGKFIAFSRKGRHRHKAQSKIGTKAVQFVERPRSEVIKRRNLRYYTSGGKKARITSAMLNYHKQLAGMERWRRLHRKNNPALNPLHNQKDTKKSRKNKHKKNKHSSRKSDKKKSSDKQPKEKKESGRFPPNDRLRSKERKG